MARKLLAFFRGSLYNQQRTADEGRFVRIPYLNGDIAQLVERCVRNAEVTCSSHAISTNQTHFRTLIYQGAGVCFFMFARKTPISSGACFLPEMAGSP